MSLAPKFMLEVNIKGKWELLRLTASYGNTIEECDLMPWNGMHELFSALKCDRGINEDYCVGIHEGLPDNCSQDVKDIYAEWFREDSGDRAKYISLSDIAYTCAKAPKVMDYESLDPEPSYTDNPLISFMSTIKSWVDISLVFFDNVDEHMSDVRLIYWVV